MTVIAVIAACGLALSGCSAQARAERLGKQAGDEICHAKNANNANDAQRHLNRANNKLNDLARYTGRDVRQDIRDLDRNLNQLARGNGTQNEISAVVRSVQEARASARGNALAAYDGLIEGLAACD
jgi:hypothetical protein